MDDRQRSNLAAWLKQSSGTSTFDLVEVRLLSGGAIQQNWQLDVRTDGVAQSWVLRMDAPATLPGISHPRDQEFALLRTAHGAGVTVPEPLFLCADPTLLGSPFFVMRKADGIAAGHRVVRSDTLGGGREALAASLGRELARIHAIRPPCAELAFLGDPPADPCTGFVATMQAQLDAGRLPRPMLEWGLRHLERDAAPPADIVLCHNDFRTGNYMVTEAGITAVLDWEFAGWGDPHADIGWLCARCWRFGAEGEVGGIAPRRPFVLAYEQAAGRSIDPDRVRWWELAAHIRWAAIAIAQAERHVSGREPSLELALTGHIVPELELEVMRMTTGGQP
ncbi:Phosphotransferase family protein [Rhodovastum atsumiense]|uniref:Phosphotransferase family protein n=1 Tax=Rhodovastum atsumiense TaxID=504468 RepID=A0A5M6IY02_9PROT|nr:phosphotransferase family protein [Rhodovastum atsumiense]KAA5613192.1 phosphotransferase family protein [Rhodovastum atsumiense]CAH2600656.1 Phosphotransferase family protein [Rhodovastum atsumiense]